MTQHSTAGRSDLPVAGSLERPVPVARTISGERPYYLDYHAHTPIDPEVLAAMSEAYGHADANPHSTHSQGLAAHAAVENAREQLARLLGCRASEIVLTSGATEANNLAFAGVTRHLEMLNRRHVLVSSIEHPSVIEAARMLAERGYRVEIIPADRHGRIWPEAIAEMMSDETGLVSVGWANHEIGAIQPIEAIAALAKTAGALFHSDLAQAAGKVPVDCSYLDLASVSAHKICGPVGIGALVVSRRLRPKMVAHIVGGGQERGMRSGTVSAPLAIAFGTACELALRHMKDESQRVTAMRDELLELLRPLPGFALNGSMEDRLPGNLNVSFDGVDGEALVMALRESISISTGSACSARSIEPSPVLLAVGLSKAQAETAVRIGLGRFTTLEQVLTAAAAIANSVEKLRLVRKRA